MVSVLKIDQNFPPKLLDIVSDCQDASARKSSNHAYSVRPNTPGSNTVVHF